MCMILLVLLGKVCLAWPPCPSYSYNFSILCLSEYSKDQLLVKRTHDILFLFLLLLLLGGTIALFQVLGVGEVAGFPRRDKSWWEAEHITPTLVALATLPCIVATCLAVTLPLLWTLPNTRFAPVVLCHLITVASQDLRQEQLKYKFCLAVLKLSATSKVELIQATSTNAMLM